MGEVVPAGLSQTDVTALLGSLGLGDIGTYTVATMPDPAASARRTAWVSDLYGVGGRVVSEGGAWKPIRPLVAGDATSATMTVQPFVTPTVLVLTGSLGLGITHTVTLGTGTGFAVPYPGYRQRVVKPSGVLGTLSVVGSLVKALTGWADYDFIPGTGWVQTASGGIL